MYLVFTTSLLFSLVLEFQISVPSIFAVIEVRRGQLVIDLCPVLFPVKFLLC
jgi:hypothetical protein